MNVISGRGAELRGYLRYVAALFHPGGAVPVFHDARQPVGSITSKLPEAQDLIIEEGRRQIGRQGEAMQQNHTRAATLLTVTVAELVFLAKSGPNVFDHSLWVVIPWLLSVTLAVFALAGTVSVLTSSATYGYVHVVDLVDSSEPTRAELARLYAEAVGVGESTNAARLTILRDAVWLAVLAAIVLVTITPFSGSRDREGACRGPQGTVCVPSQNVRPTPTAAAQPSPSAAQPTSTATAKPSNTPLPASSSTP